MKNDRYIKVVLTIIAICLVWICIRDMKVGGNFLFAKTPSAGGGQYSGTVDVRVLSVNRRAFNLIDPIEVKVTN